MKPTRSIVILALFTLSLAAQNPPSFRVDVPLVTVDVLVSDANGRPVVNLSRDDFFIFEDGRPQVIQNFSTVESPYSILLLLDRSTSMQDYWPLMEPAMARFIGQLRPQDSISIGAFDERSRDVDLLLDWRQARIGVTREIGINPAIQGLQYSSVRIASGGSASMSMPTKDPYQALEWAIKRLNGVAGRKGILVFTDGYPAKAPAKTVEVGGRRTMRFGDAKDDGAFQGLLRMVSQSQVSVYIVGIGTDLNPRDGVFSEMAIGFGLPIRSRFEALAEVSGGRVILPLKMEDTLTMYEEIGRTLGSSFTLGYSPTGSNATGNYRRVEIRGREPAWRIKQSREGYTLSSR